MLKLSDRPHPAWVRRPNPTVGHTRLHWLAAHCTADPRPGIGEPQPNDRADNRPPMTPSAPKPDLSASRRSGSPAHDRATLSASAPKPDLSASRRSGSAAAPSPATARREARVIAMAAARCADCGRPATGVTHTDANPRDSAAPAMRPACDTCRTQQQGGPLADLMAGVMSRFSVAARSA